LAVGWIVGLDALQEPRGRVESTDSVTRTKTRGVMANVTSCRRLEELGKEDA